MFKNYFIIAARNLLQYKAYTSINLIGLIIGLTCSTLILLYMQHEFSYDRHHSNADRISRVFLTQRQPNGEMIYRYAAQGPVAPTLAEELPEVERATRFMHRSVYVGTEGRESVNAFVTVADAEFFNIFDFPAIQGNTETDLHPPFSIFITQSFAQKLFGDTNPIGKTVLLDSKLFGDTYTISGILKDIPKTSTFGLAPELITITPPRKAPYRMMGVWEGWGTGSVIAYTYVLLRPDALRSSLEKKLPGFARDHLGEEDAKNNQYKLMPLNQLHLHGSKYGILRINGDIKTCYTLGLIGIVIVVVACINFMNLSTALSARRMREVGMRKVVGAQRVQLIFQFLSESILLSILSLILALGLTELTLPMLSGFMQTHLSLNINIVPGLMMLAIGVGILAGSYPAFFLSSFHPISVLKGMPNTKGGHTSVRKGLVVVQFAISVVLIIGTLIVSQQIEYMRTKNPGFKKDALITTSKITKNAVAMKNQFQQLSGVQNATITHRPIFGDLFDGDSQNLKSVGMNTPINAYLLLTDPEFLVTHEIPLFSGHQFNLQDFSTAFSTGEAIEGTRNILLNETAAQELGIQVGDIVKASDMPNDLTFNVIGIFKDFHHISLHHSITPLMLLPVINELQSYITMRVDMQDLPNVLTRLEETWKTFEPDRSFEFRFMDEARDQAYLREMKLSRIYALSSGLAIVIACIGLLGLIAYTAEVRTKEIGIRKVLGATEVNIISLLTKEFLVLVAIASLLAYPIAYYIMGRWLQNFAYRIDLGLTQFLVATGATILITLMTIAYQALKAARANPIDALRYE